MQIVQELIKNKVFAENYYIVLMIVILRQVTVLNDVFFIRRLFYNLIKQEDLPIKSKQITILISFTEDPTFELAKCF